MASTINTARMAKSSVVRKHEPHAMEKAAGIADNHVNEITEISQAFTLLESGEVDCSAKTKEDPEPVTSELCHILAGDNNQVAGKLERAVKGLSLRPKNGDETEMVVADKVEDGLLTHLRAALWDMWFCAKRAAPPCDPMTSKDKRVKAAREQAFDALRAIHTHSEDSSAGAQLAEHTATQGTSAQPTEELPAMVAGQESALLQTEETVQQTPVSATSEWADNVLHNMLTPGVGAQGEQGVPGKIYEAINNLDATVNLQGGIVGIKDDESGSIKKLKADMLLLHECASMADCGPNGTTYSDTCCSPRNSNQAVYIQARNDAYVAYHNVLRDDDMAAQEYKMLLATIADKKTEHKRWSHKEAWTKEHEEHHERIHGNATHNRHGVPHPPKTNNTNITYVAPVEEVDNNEMLICGLAGVGLVVLSAIVFLAWKMRQEPEPWKQHMEQESWEGEGWEGNGEYNQY